MSRRDQIKMSPPEQAAFLAEQRVVSCASNGPHGWPHVMPLWYVQRDGEIWVWTYAKSQKTKNLMRDPRATLTLEDGEQYHELRGVMIEAHATIHRERKLVASVGAQIFERYGSGAGGPEFIEVVRAQAAKRVALQFTPRRTSTWDHGKLGGVY